MNSDNSNSIESVLQEQRVFPPSEDFASKSRISSFSKYLEMSQMAKSDPNKFWGDAAREELNWFKSLIRYWIGTIHHSLNGLMEEK